jgi:hypothetical protein
MKTIRKQFILTLAISTFLAGCVTPSPKHSICEYQIVEGHLPKLNEKIAELAQDGWQIVTVTPTEKPPGGFQFVVVTLKRCQ